METSHPEVTKTVVVKHYIARVVSYFSDPTSKKWQNSIYKTDLTREDFITKNEKFINFVKANGGALAYIPLDEFDKYVIKANLS